MNDIFGNELALGDTVAFYAPNYRDMTIGKIIKFTPKQVRVEYMNTWNYTSGMKQEYLNYPCNFAKKVV